MPLRDLSGKTVSELELDDFEMLFCWRCRKYMQCTRNNGNILECKAAVDSGLWDQSCEAL